MGKDVIIACDFSSGRETMEFLDRFEEKPFVKIGMELFYAEGPQMIDRIRERGHRIFLDLKLHDIPNTVEKAMRVIAGLEVDMCNVHAGGTKKMMEAALRGLGEGDGRPLLIAVTQLTSTDQAQLKEDLLIDRSMEDVVSAYAASAKKAGLDGVVCSPLEAPAVHKALGDSFLTVTPGVRLPGDPKADQSRVTTPAEAKKLGADYIVVGRSITGAKDPEEAYMRCMREFCD